jgi:hypothetical protein
MKTPTIFQKLNKTEIFDIAKVLHYYFPHGSTARIYDLILQVDSIDKAVDVLFFTKDGECSINEGVFAVLHWKDVENG